MHLLNSIVSNIFTTIDTDSTFDYIVQTEVIQAFSLQSILKLMLETPSAYIYPVSSEFSPVSMARACQDHVYRVGVSVLIDDFGESNVAFIGDYKTPSESKGVTQIAADFQTVFNREDFSVDQLEAYYVGENYTGVQFGERALAHVAMSLLYEYSDIG